MLIKTPVQFYIDTENVPSSLWSGVFQQLSCCDAVNLYVTNSTLRQEITLATMRFLLNKLQYVNFIDCQVGCKNALDFILISDLSRNVVTAKKTYHVIVSNDHGYDGAVERLVSLGYNVSRVNEAGDMNSVLRARAEKYKEISKRK